MKINNQKRNYQRFFSQPKILQNILSKKNCSEKFKTKKYSPIQRILGTQLKTKLFNRFNFSRNLSKIGNIKCSNYISTINGRIRISLNFLI